MPEPATIHEQVEPYFELHRNYPDRYKCRTARRYGVPATIVTAWYAVMHDLASNAATFGEFTTDVRAFEEAVGEPERHGTSAEDVAKDRELAGYWRSLERAHLCDIVEGQPEPIDGVEGLPITFRVRVHGMSTRPRRAPLSDAERARRYRERRRGEDPEASRPVTNVTEPRDASRRHVTSRGTSQPVDPANQSIQKIQGQSSVGAEPLVRGRARGAANELTTDLSDLDSGTAYELERLLAELRDADDGTRGVLAHLARKGAGAADFADARQAIQACTPLRPAAYAVTTISNRIGGAA